MSRRRPRIPAVDALRVELDKRGWTQNELAKKLGVNSGTLSRWLGGRTPPLRVLLWIESELGVSPSMWLPAT